MIKSICREFDVDEEITKFIGTIRSLFYILIAGGIIIGIYLIFIKIEVKCKNNKKA